MVACFKVVTVGVVQDSKPPQTLSQKHCCMFRDLATKQVCGLCVADEDEK